jgi:predicted AlkP superfamily pyrophosphatase or phosphodiesterase
MKRFLSHGLVLLFVFSSIPAWARTLVVISIDGMKPGYVTEAAKHGIRLPNLERFMKQGTYADGVVGVAPTVTYPSHTTLMTGVWPAEHGILSNTTFDPLRKNLGGWYWYASAIRVPTLWEVAGNKGIVVASIAWPVSVDAKGVTYLIPEYWRTYTADDGPLVDALSRPAGWLAELEKKLGPYEERSPGALVSDQIRTRYSVEILRTKKLGFMTIHLAALDHAEHETGPFSSHSNETLEALDGLIGQIEAAALANDPDAIIAVVSDHGFARTDYRINLLLPFIEDGLLKVKPATATKEATVDSWDATLWPAGGSAAVMLREPDNAELKLKVQALLEKMKDDPKYGIARIVAQEELKKLGAFPDATFLIEMKSDFQPGFALAGKLVDDIPSTGMHGYLPDNPELRASFFIHGKGIAAGRDVGLIDMRQIAPTFAGLLGVELPSAKEKAINVQQ